MIFINTRFPKTKKTYQKAADQNVDKLIKTMKSIIIAETKEPDMPKGTGVAYRPAQKNSNAWSYNEKKRSKPKTFSL